MKPNLFLVGAPKCGTTSWVKYLGDHPDIAFSDIKEPHYFCLDLPGMRSVSTPEDYEALFADSGEVKIVGEASVMYLFSTVAAKEIARFNPDARIIILLRQQEDFLPSLHYQFLFNFQESFTEFEPAWRLSGQRPAATVPKTCREPRLLDYEVMGRFDTQVERYFANFSPDRIRVFQFNDWISDPRTTYLEILRFLGLEDDGRTDFRPLNEAKHYKSKLIARLTQHPPSWMLLPVRLLKKLTGRKSFGTARRINRFNVEKGYRSVVDAELKEEIRTHYQDCNAKVAPSVWRPDGAKAAFPDDGGYTQ